jgi:hypothetical protein
MARPTKTERITIAQRRNRAVEMRINGETWQVVADALGYRSPGAACADVGRAREQQLAELTENLDQLRTMELDHLDMLRRKAVAVLQRHHVYVSGGRIVRDGLSADEVAALAKAGVEATIGEPLEDDAPVLAAIDRLLKINERRSRLLGLDQPVLVQGDLVHHIVEGVDLGALT